MFARLFLIFIVLRLTLVAHGQEANNSNHTHRTNNVVAQLDRYFQALTDLKHFNGNVIVAENGQVLLDRTYNIQGYPAGMRVGRNSQFIIASVSKALVKFSVLKLVEEHRLRLDDPLSRFIPDFPAGDKITIEELMNHKSGLPRELTGFDTYTNLTLAQVVTLAKKEKLQFAPNTGTLYSNVGFMMLHYVISRAAPEGYPQFTKNLLLEMGLTETGEYDSAAHLSRFAWGYDCENGSPVPTPAESISRFETGNYYSTIADLYRFSTLIFSGQFLDKPLALKLVGPEGALIQAGGRPGYRAYFYKRLNPDLTFIFLANYSEIPIQKLTGDIVNLLDHKPYELPVAINREPIAVSPDVLKRYAGRYVLDADSTQAYTFFCEDGALVLLDDSGEKTRLSADTETTFFTNPQSNDGFAFSLNSRTGHYDLTITATGLRLTTQRLP